MNKSLGKTKTTAQKVSKGLVDYYSKNAGLSSESRRAVIRERQGRK